MTEERERRRMASYLHDVIGQTLAMCKLKIRSLQRSAVPDASEKALQELRELIEQSIHNTQSLTFELCPPILYELNLEAAIEWLAERFQQQHSITFHVENDRIPKPMSDEARVILFQAVREIFVNIVKHAEARTVNVQMKRDDSSIQIIICDDGVGFDPKTVSAVTMSAAKGGFGLFNVRERLMSIGGNLEIQSSSQMGTKVSIRCPLLENVKTDSGEKISENEKGAR